MTTNTDAEIAAAAETLDALLSLLPGTTTADQLELIGTTATEMRRRQVSTLDELRDAFLVDHLAELLAEHDQSR